MRLFRRVVGPRAAWASTALLGAAAACLSPTPVPKGAGGSAGVGPCEPGLAAPAPPEVRADPAEAAHVAGPWPRYPESMLTNGETGRVRAQFVLDTAGRVEPGSLAIEASTHRFFSASVCAAAGRATYTPVRRAGRPVRALVAGVPFEFKLSVQP